MQKRKSLSYAFMGSEKPLIGMTVGDMFDEIVELYPDREALVSQHQGVRYTWRELQTQVNRAAKGLLSLGYKKGDRVAIWAHERGGVGDHPVGDGQGGHHHDQHQPRLPHARAGVRPQAVRGPGTAAHRLVQDLQLRQNVQRGLPGSEGIEAGEDHLGEPAVPQVGRAAARR